MWTIALGVAFLTSQSPQSSTAIASICHATMSSRYLSGKKLRDFVSGYNFITEGNNNYYVIAFNADGNFTEQSHWHKNLGRWIVDGDTVILWPSNKAKIAIVSVSNEDSILLSVAVENKCVISGSFKRYEQEGTR